MGAGTPGSLTGSIVEGEHGGERSARLSAAADQRGPAVTGPSVPPSRARARSRAAALAALVALLLALAACGGDDGAGPGESGTTVPAGQDLTEEPGATEGPDAEGDGALRVLVTNDDGYDSDGLDTIVEALAAMEAAEVELHVVAPLDQQSGQGGRTTEGEVATSPVETASGREATAVDGFPADAVRVALDEMELEVDLVVSGINHGQNIGVIVDVSGTVGAARAAAARGVPALALSADLQDPDYDATAELAVGWIEERVDALRDGEAPVAVESINVPTCPDGPRDLVEVDVAGDDAPNPLGATDCEADLTDPAHDVEAYLGGFASLTVLPGEPAGPEGSATTEATEPS